MVRKPMVRELKESRGRKKSFARMIREAGNGILPTAQDLADERLTELGQRVMLALLVRQAKLLAGPRNLKELAAVTGFSFGHLSRAFHDKVKVSEALNDRLSVALPEARIPRFAPQPPQLRRAAVSMRAKRIAHRLRQREEDAREKRFLRNEQERKEYIQWAKDTGNEEALVGLPPLEVPRRIAEARYYVNTNPPPRWEASPEIRAQVEERLAKRAADAAAVDDLRKWRMEEARISYVDAAALSGLTLRQIRFLELGDRRVRPETRDILAAFVARWRAEHTPPAPGAPDESCRTSGDTSASSSPDPEPPAAASPEPARPAQPLPQPAFRLVPPPGSASGAPDVEDATPGGGPDQAAAASRSPSSGPSSHQ